MEGLQQFEESPIAPLIDCLDSSRTVHVSYRRYPFTNGRMYRCYQQHVRTRRVQREIAVCLLLKNGRRKRAKGLAILDFPVNFIKHLRLPRIGQDTPISQRTRTKFHPSLEPADYFTFCESASGDVQHLRPLEAMVHGSFGAKGSLDLCGGIAGSK